MRSVPRTALWLAVFLATGCAAAPPVRHAPSDEISYQLLVTFHASSEVSQVRRLRELARTFGLEPLAAWPMESLGELCAVLNAPQGATPLLAARLRGQPGVSSAQPVQRFRTLGGRGYDDPYLELQYGLRDVPLAAIHARVRGDGVRVALVDTGVDVSHPDLEGRVLKAANLAPASAESFTEDRHGTAIAGIVAARPGNGQGIVGLAPASRLLVFKTCWYEDGDSDVAVCDSYTLARGLDAALVEEADVINLSLTGPPDPLLGRLLDEAADRRIPVVVAVDEQAADGSGFPANRPEVLRVRSAGPRPARTVEGPPPAGGAVAAPGVDVLSTAPRGSYDFFTGSSYAAAFVTGLVALLLDQRPELTPDEILARLAASEDETPDPCLALFADDGPLCP